jgi:hypothetical protein
MAEESINLLRCTISGHAFDFNSDLGAVSIGKGAACTPCMDQLFAVNGALHPNGERPQTTTKKPKKHTPFRHRRMTNEHD